MFCSVPLFHCSAVKITYMWLNNVKYDIFEQAQHRMQVLTVMIPLKKGELFEQWITVGEGS